MKSVAVSAGWPSTVSRVRDEFTCDLLRALDERPELAALPDALVLDGELIAFGADGRPSFRCSGTSAEGAALSIVSVPTTFASG